MLRKIIASFVMVCFITTLIQPLSHAAQAPLMASLPVPGTMVSLSPAFDPAMIKGLTVHKDNPFLFDFIVDTGDSALSSGELKKEGDRLVKYFFTCLTVPEKDLWVNLSPYEKDRMVPQALGKTALGRDLLAQDYILKQITASLIYPEKELGKKFWDKVYAKAQQLYGTTNIPVNTFNKVWILADKASVYENGQSAFVLDGHLKVMLEEDYLAMQKHSPTDLPSANQNVGASQVVREVILPQLEKEVNTGKNFAALRQIFNSLILANWYKNNLKEALITQVYADKNTVKGVHLNDLSVKEQIYQQYLKAYKKGVFNYIKEEPSTSLRPGATSGSETIPRKYFSGGFGARVDTKVYTNGTIDSTHRAMLSFVKKTLAVLTVALFLNNPLAALKASANPIVSTPPVASASAASRAMLSEKQRIEAALATIEEYKTGLITPEILSSMVRMMIRNKSKVYGFPDSFKSEDFGGYVRTQMGDVKDGSIVVNFKYTIKANGTELFPTDKHFDQNYYFTKVSFLEFFADTLQENPVFAGKVFRIFDDQIPPIKNPRTKTEPKAQSGGSSKTMTTATPLAAGPRVEKLEGGRFLLSLGDIPKGQDVQFVLYNEAIATLRFKIRNANESYVYSVLQSDGSWKGNVLYSSEGQNDGLPKGLTIADTDKGIVFTTDKPNADIKLDTSRAMLVSFEPDERCQLIRDIEKLRETSSVQVSKSKSLRRFEEESWHWFIPEGIDPFVISEVGTRLGLEVNAHSTHIFIPKESFSSPIDAEQRISFALDNLTNELKNGKPRIYTSPEEALQYEKKDWEGKSFVITRRNGKSTVLKLSKITKKGFAGFDEASKDDKSGGLVDVLEKDFATGYMLDKAMLANYGQAEKNNMFNDIRLLRTHLDSAVNRYDITHKTVDCEFYWRLPYGLKSNVVRLISQRLGFKYIDNKGIVEIPKSRNPYQSQVEVEKDISLALNTLANELQEPTVYTSLGEMFRDLTQEWIGKKFVVVTRHGERFVLTLQDLYGNSFVGINDQKQTKTIPDTEFSSAKMVDEAMNSVDQKNIDPFERLNTELSTLEVQLDKPTKNRKPIYKSRKVAATVKDLLNEIINNEKSLENFNYLRCLLRLISIADQYPEIKPVLYHDLTLEQLKTIIRVYRDDHHAETIIILNNGEYLLNKESREVTIKQIMAVITRRFGKDPNKRYSVRSEYGNGEILKFDINDAAMNSVDRAAIVNLPPQKSPWERGGIDLSAANMAMTITKAPNGGVKVNFDPAMIASLRRTGVDSAIPVIINVSILNPKQIQPLLGFNLGT